MTIGLVDIVKIFDIPYKDLSEKMDISPKTVNDWVKGRKKIPKPRLEQLAEIFGIQDKNLFQKELTDKERRDIQILYLQQTDTFYEVEEPVFQDGKEYTATHMVSENKYIIDLLEEQNEVAELFEEIHTLVDQEHYRKDENRRTIRNVLRIIQNDENRKKRTFGALLYALVEADDFSWGVSPEYSELYKNGFFEELDTLLTKHKLK